MRLAFFTTRMLLGYGVDLTVAQIARRLVQQHGHSVDVWTPTSDGTYGGEPFNVRKLYIYGGEANRVLPVLECNAWRALRRLRRQLECAGEAYDAVIPCTHPYYGAGRALGLPSVFFNFGNVPTAGFSWKGKLNRRWLDISDRHWLARSAACVHISHFLAAQHKHVRQRKSYVIHLGGDHYYPAADGAGARFRQQHSIPADAIVVGFCGRLYKDHPPYKGTPELLKLAQRLHMDEPRARLVMCGIGSEADVEWVRSHGAVAAANLPPVDMPGFFSALDIYACASRWEGFNLPLVEAAWHSVPGVAYDAGAHGEHVTQVLVEDGDAQALYSAVLELVRDADRRRLLAARSFEVAQGFSWDNAAGQLGDVLEGLGT